MTNFSEKWDRQEKLPWSYHPIKFESYSKCKEQLSFYLPMIDKTLDASVEKWYCAPLTHCVLVRKNKVTTFYVNGEEYHKLKLGRRQNA